MVTLLSLQFRSGVPSSPCVPFWVGGPRLPQLSWPVVWTLLLLSQQHPSHLKAQRRQGLSKILSPISRPLLHLRGWFPLSPALRSPRRCTEVQVSFKRLPPSGFRWRCWSFNNGISTHRALPLLISVLHTPRTVDYRPPTKSHHHRVPGCTKRGSRSAAISRESPGLQPASLHTQALYSESLCLPGGAPRLPSHLPPTPCTRVTSWPNLVPSRMRIPQCNFDFSSMHHRRGSLDKDSRW